MATKREVELVRRVCKHCGKRFTVVKGQAKRRGCPECESSLLDAQRAS